MLKNAVITVIIMMLIAFSIVLPASYVFYLGKILIDNIIVRVKGDKYIGICEKYIIGRNGGLDVYWNDGKRNHHQIFHVLSLKFKYPHKIKMYFFDNCANLGFLTVIINFIYFSFCICLDNLYYGCN